MPHAERPRTAIAGKAFSGGSAFDEPPFKVTAANITQDKETGIGNWSDADIKKLLRTGQSPKGVQIAMVMPTGFYHAMTERDLDAVVAYLRTIKPVSNKVPDPVYKMPQVESVLPGAEKPVTESELGDKVKKGQYLATHRALHGVPHADGTEGSSRFHQRARGGRLRDAGPLGHVGFTQHHPEQDQGHRRWTDAEIKRAITQGISRDGSHLKPPMGFGYYAHMTDADLNALVAWLRTVPAKE